MANIGIGEALAAVGLLALISFAASPVSNAAKQPPITQVQRKPVQAAPTVRVAPANEELHEVVELPPTRARRLVRVAEPAPPPATVSNWSPFGAPDQLGASER